MDNRLAVEHLGIDCICMLFPDHSIDCLSLTASMIKCVRLASSCISKSPDHSRRYTAVANQGTLGNAQSEVNFVVVYS
jgi:hypothetical protein